MVAEEGKKLVIVINKADLVPREVLEEWKRVLSREHPTIYVGARERLGTRFLWRIIKRVTDKRPVVVAVVGLPNVGKSTILNVLKGRHSVSTSPVPGWTKHATLARAATWLKVIDTPGVVPRGEEEELAVRGALRPESLEDPVPAALKLIEVLRRKEPDFLKKYYGVYESDPLRALEELARRRNLLKKGGEPNVEEAARVLLRDWQSGELAVYFTPEDYGLRPRRKRTKEAARGGSGGNSSAASSAAREGPPPSS
jgi:ribosome biogenesis GTPase A